MSAVKKIGGDKAIWIVVIALAIFSFLPVYSASSNFGANLIFSNILLWIQVAFKKTINYSNENCHIDDIYLVKLKPKSKKKSNQHNNIFYFSI